MNHSQILYNYLNSGFLNGERIKWIFANKATLLKDKTISENFALMCSYLSTYFTVLDILEKNKNNRAKERAVEAKNLFIDAFTPLNFSGREIEALKQIGRFLMIRHRNILNFPY